jgi:hypothetical protein
MEKEHLAIATQPATQGVASGETTPASPSSDDGTRDDGDKRLEAMGYTPVCLFPSIPSLSVLVVTLTSGPRSSSASSLGGPASASP